MKVLVHAKSATQEQRDRGVLAAWQVFNANDVSPWSTAVARFKRDSWDDSGCPADESKPTLHEFKLASVWDEAERNALDACFERDTTIDYDIGHLEVQQ
jgi:hypothetical protein